MLNFLVNTLNKEIDIELSENADIDSEDIFEVLVGATADEDSVSHLYETTEETPHGNTILHYHDDDWQSPHAPSPRPAH